jgi:hypothetical protein
MVRRTVEIIVAVNAPGHDGNQELRHVVTVRVQSRRPDNARISVNPIALAGGQGLTIHERLRDREDRPHPGHEVAWNVAEEKVLARF